MTLTLTAHRSKNLLATAAKVVTACLTVILTWGCSDKNGGPDEPAPQPVHTTVLVYMAACNDLGAEGYDAQDIAEMQAAVSAGALQGGRLLLYHAGTEGIARLTELKGKNQTLIAEYDDQLTSVNTARMARVIADARRAAPSQNFGLVLWSHGSGWLEDGIAGDQEASVMSWGAERMKKMNITSLQSVLENAKPDFVYFDCCFMASVEVAYQLRHATPLIVAGCTELPATGMPYDKTVPFFFRPGGPDLTGAAKATFDFYDAKTDPEERTCTISVIRTDAMDELAGATAGIFGGAAQTWPQGYEPQQFMLPSRCWYFDLDDYVHMLADRQAAPGKYDRFARALGHAVVYKASTPRLWDAIALKKHCGLSTYIFADRTSFAQKGYDTLAWPQKVWPRFYLP